MNDIARIMRSAYDKHFIIPAFNIPHLPMMEPVVQALRETRSFGLIAVARLEWMKFSAQSISAVAAEYERVGDASVTRLHLDHVPVIDEGPPLGRLYEQYQDRHTSRVTSRS